MWRSFPDVSDTFLGTGSSIADAFCKGVDTLPLAVVVLIFGSAFALFGLAAADFLLLIVVVARLLI